jgi:hypothetical protein
MAVVRTASALLVVLAMAFFIGRWTGWRAKEGEFRRDRDTLLAEIKEREKARAEEIDREIRDERSRRFAEEERANELAQRLDAKIRDLELLKRRLVAQQGVPAHASCRVAYAAQPSMSARRSTKKSVRR